MNCGRCEKGCRKVAGLRWNHELIWVKISRTRPKKKTARNWETGDKIDNSTYLAA